MALDAATRDALANIKSEQASSLAITRATSTAQSAIAAANMANQLHMGLLSTAVEATRGVVNSIKDAAKDGNDAIKKP